MTIEQLRQEAERFFEWDTEDHSLVTLTSCLLFAGHMARQERERCARIAEGFERRERGGWVKGSLYDSLRREVAAEIRGL